MVDSSDIGVLVAGMGIGVAGFMPMLAVVLLARKKRMRPTVGKGMAALAISFVFLMAVFALMWLWRQRMWWCLRSGSSEGS